MALSWLGRIRRAASLAYWRRAAARIGRADLIQVKRLRAHARTVQQATGRVLYLAESRLTGPLTGADFPARRAITDEVWRPPVWLGPVVPVGSVATAMRTVIDDDLSVFHDCRTSEVVVRQVRNSGFDAAARFGLALDALNFDGTFLSIALRLPQGLIAGLGHRHVLCAALALESERPCPVLVSLNIEHGPNVEKSVIELAAGDGARLAEFDLAHVRFDEKRVSKVWIDLFFTQAAMNRVVVRDMLISRRPRAEL